MKSLSNDKARHVRVRAFVAYPAFSVALVVSIALALTPLGPTTVMALVEPTPTATATTTPGPSPTETTAPAPASVATTTTSVATTPAPSTEAPAPSSTASPTVDIVVPTETLAPTGRGDGTVYDLVAAAEPIDGTVSDPAVASLAVASLVPDIHGPYSMATDKCGICHRTHTAKSRNLLTKPGSQSNLCFACHDGTGANANVKAQFDDPAVPQNDNVKRLYYRHDTAAIAHTRAGDNEYGGVSNRHTECSDCHNPHQARGTDGAPTGTTTARDGTGATASGRLNGVSGVSVVNSLTPNGAPAYKLLDGLSPETSITREYQLCFKCHSGSTVLSSNAGFVPSRYRLDKGIEFNPNNPSYHPVEAPGKNTTPKMAASLAGGTIWKFTTGSTIRCVNCHASSTKYSLVTPPSANGDLPMHTSKNPGILLANYRNRILKPQQEGFRETDFALCFMCHSKTPFQNQTTTATNFGLHGKHTAQLAGDGNSSVITIDTPRAGGGNAICAECHFRQHSTSFKDVTAPQTIPGSRLVSFAPNVTGLRKWAPGTLGQGSCTLTCHGKSHSGEGYSD